MSMPFPPLIAVTALCVLPAIGGIETDEAGRLPCDVTTGIGELAVCPVSMP